MIFTLTLALVLVAILGAVYRPGARRAFWLGFALFGSTYFLFTFVPSFRLIEHQLFGKQASIYFGKHAPEASSGIVIGPEGNRVAVFSFDQIIHSICTLLFAGGGGLASVYFYATRGTP